MVLSAPGNTASRGQRLLDLNAVLNSDKPEGAIAFTKGTYSFNWSWTFTDPAIGVSFPFGPVVGVGQVNNLALYNDPTKNPLLPSSYETSGTYTGTVKAGDLFGFGLISSNPSTWQTGIATGTITNFQFIAEYSEVPGPLPLAGAAAGFAWSRRLRRRLKTAQSVV